MILFTILAFVALLLIGFIILVASVGGAVFVIIFGDVIVCIAIIVFIIKLIAKRKRK